MEASNFGFGLSMPPAFKFDPTDDDIVAHYLLPRALGVRDPPFGAAVHQADTASLRLPPLELLASHGHKHSHQAFFFDVTENGGRRERVVKGGDGGMWRGQKPYYHTLTLLRPGGGEVDITYKRYHLTYKTLGEEEEEKEEKSKKRKWKKQGEGGTPTGWVMHEYQIISPPLHNTVLSRIKRTNEKIKEDRQRAQAETEQAVDPADQHHHVVPALEQPCPSYYQGDFPYQEPSYRQDFPYQEQTGHFPYQEQAGPSYYQDHPLNMNCSGGEGFGDGSQVDDVSCYTDNGFVNMLYAGEDLAGGGGKGFSDCSQADDASCYGVNGGDMGDGFVNMLCPGEGFAGDYTYMCVGGEGFSDGSQAADASCYGGNGSGMGDSFTNMLYAGEGFASDNTYNGNNLYYHGINFSSGSDI